MWSMNEVVLQGEKQINPESYNTGFTVYFSGLLTYSQLKQVFCNHLEDSWQIFLGPSNVTNKIYYSYYKDDH